MPIYRDPKVHRYWREKAWNFPRERKYMDKPFVILLTKQTPFIFVCFVILRIWFTGVIGEKLKAIKMTFGLTFSIGLF